MLSLEKKRSTVTASCVFIAFSLAVSTYVLLTQKKNFRLLFIRGTYIARTNFNFMPWVMQEEWNHLQQYRCIKEKRTKKKNHYENTFMFLANRTSASTLNWTHEKPHNFKAASVKFTILKIMHNTIKSWVIHTVLEQSVFVCLFVCLCQCRHVDLRSTCTTRNQTKWKRGCVDLKDVHFTGLFLPSSMPYASRTVILL